MTHASYSRSQVSNSHNGGGLTACGTFCFGETDKFLEEEPFKSLTEKKLLKRFTDDLGAERIQIFSESTGGRLEPEHIMLALVKPHIGANWMLDMRGSPVLGKQMAQEEAQKYIISVLKRMTIPVSKWCFAEGKKQGCWSIQKGYGKYCFAVSMNESYAYANSINMKQMTEEERSKGRTMMEVEKMASCRFIYSQPDGEADYYHLKEAFKEKKEWFLKMRDNYEEWHKEFLEIGNPDSPYYTEEEAREQYLLEFHKGLTFLRDTKVWIKKFRTAIKNLQFPLAKELLTELSAINTEYIEWWREFVWESEIKEAEERGRSQDKELSEHAYMKYYEYAKYSYQSYEKELNNIVELANYIESQ